MARILALVVGGWWTYSGVASGLSLRLDAFGILLHVLVPGGIILVTLALAWRWEGFGGFLLTLEGLAALIFIINQAFGPSGIPWEPSTVLTLFVTLAGPLLLAGILFLTS